MRKLGLMLGLCVLAGCVQSDPETASESVLQQMAWLKTAHPKEDLAAALRASDYRFVGIRGLTASFPGIEEDCAAKVKNARYVAGTSDAILSDEHAELIAKAEAYARQYNTALLAELNKKGESPCSP